MIRPSRLPQAARDKLAEINMQMVVAQDSIAALANRLNMLGREGSDEIRAKLTAEQARQQHRHGQIHRLVSHINQFLEELPHTAILQPVPAVDVDLNGATLDAAISDVRTRIVAIGQHLAAVKLAPLPPADLENLVTAYVLKLAQAARPTVSVVGDKLRVGFRGDMANAEDVLAMLCWVLTKPVCEALDAELAAGHPTAASLGPAMPVAERNRRTAELEQTLLELERREEALIMRAHGDGLVDVLRRPAADPRAVLSVVVARQAQAVAVA